MKMRNPSPLRYPGGKASLTPTLEKIIYSNNLQGCVYVEPFAGGVGAGLKLLTSGHVDRVIINDIDRSVSSFWLSVMKDTDEFVERIMTVPLNVKEWEKQREIYRHPKGNRRFDRAFATFYLNRCNRSGIIMNGGPIGGSKQNGKWKIDARFNREDLAKRILNLSDFGDRITVLSEDAANLVRNIKDHVLGERCFIYADPPYYVKGSELYLSAYRDDDHKSFSQEMEKLDKVAWVMTYDDHEKIRKFYSNQQIHGFNLRYSAHEESRKGGEILIAPHHVQISQEVLAELKILGE